MRGTKGRLVVIYASWGHLLRLLMDTLNPDYLSPGSGCVPLRSCPVEIKLAVFHWRSVSCPNSNFGTMSTKLIPQYAPTTAEYHHHQPPHHPPPQKKKKNNNKMQGYTTAQLFDTWLYMFWANVEPHHRPLWKRPSAASPKVDGRPLVLNSPLWK